MPNSISRSLYELNMVLFHLKLLADNSAFSEKETIEKAIKLLEQAYQLLEKVESSF